MKSRIVLPALLVAGLFVVAFASDAQARILGGGCCEPSCCAPSRPAALPRADLLRSRADLLCTQVLQAALPSPPPLLPQELLPADLLRSPELRCAELRCPGPDLRCGSQLCC